jgi:hypothetical protein
MALGVDSAYNRNEYQENFLGGGGGGVKAAGADNLTTFMCRLWVNLGSSTSWIAQGLCRSVQELLYLLQRVQIMCTAGVAK